MHLRRWYFSAAKDPNIRHNASRLVPELKRLLIDYDGAGGNEDWEKRVLAKLKQADPSELLAAAQSFSRKTREKGGIIDQRLALPILERLANLVNFLDRPDLIKLIQFSSLSVNRRKALLKDPSALELQKISIDVMETAIEKLRKRLDDLPIASLSVLVSALARQSSGIAQRCVLDISSTVARHVEQCLSCREETPASAIVREDLQKMIPYLWLGLKQMEMSPDASLTESTLGLFTKFLHKTPFAYLTILIEGMSGIDDPRLREIILFSEQSFIASPGDFTLTDLCRLFAYSSASHPSDIVLDHFAVEIAEKASTEWNVHVLVQFGELFVRFSDLNTESIRARFAAELKAKASEIPPAYSSRIFCTLLKCQDGPIRKICSDILEMNMKSQTPSALFAILNALSSLKPEERKEFAHVRTKAIKQLSRFRALLSGEDRDKFNSLQRN